MWQMRATSGFCASNSPLIFVEMRLAFDAKRAMLNTTGLGNHNRALLCGLSTHFPQHDYLLLSPQKPLPAYQTLSAASNMELHLPSGCWQYLPAWWRSSRLGRLSQTLEADIFHGLSHELPLDISHFKGRKIVTIHDLIFLHFPQAYTLWDRNIHLQKVKFACEKADRVIAISQQTREDLIRLLGVPELKIRVVPPIITREMQGDAEKVRGEFVLSVSSLTFRKNLLRLIEAVELLPDVQLVIVGRGKLEKQLRAYITEKHLQQRVQILTNVDNALLRSLYKSARLFVYPSLYEGFGLPIQEAILNGLPVVAGNNACFQEAGGRGAVYVNQAQKEELAAAIANLWTDDALRQELLREGQAYMQHFSEKKLTETLMAVYEEAYRA